jgi:DNA helicase-2/ATP-dependent DNA helicase PcrA
MKPTEKQQKILDSDGHLLVTGGPGSGKTTIAILKAARIAEKKLRPGQKILFLSFARATVSRILEAIEVEQRIPPELKRLIEVETYHSCFWRILKTHGYLVGLPRRTSILTPPDEAVALSTIRRQYPSAAKMTPPQKVEKQNKEWAERMRLAREEGRVCFDLFPVFVGDLLSNSERLRSLISTRYPFIILDEFQDTNAPQWRVVMALGELSSLLALADPEQRIYDFIGADPERLNHLKKTFAPKVVDLGTENHRSPDTDIVIFGNDLLAGKFRQENYKGLEFILYEPNSGQAWTKLVTTTYAARHRLLKSGREDWSLAILVPTKKLTCEVSDALRAPPGDMKKVQHVAAIEIEGAILGSELIAHLMQPDVDENHFHRFISLLRDYFHGKGGDSPTLGDLREAENIRQAYDEWFARKSAGREIRSNSILVAIKEVYQKARELPFSGEPDKDWRALRQTLENGPCVRLKGLAEDIRYIRLLDRGLQLRQELSQAWRDHGAYVNALTITRQAFVREHFSTSVKPGNGIHVMNMHKAKGKQFDEVIIFEGWPRAVRGKIVANFDRIVRGNDRSKIDDQARQNFRVSVTRGRLRTTILTPKNDPCVLLCGNG